MVTEAGRETVHAGNSAEEPTKAGPGAAGPGEEGHVPACAAPNPCTGKVFTEEMRRGNAIVADPSDGVDLNFTDMKACNGQGQPIPGLTLFGKAL